MTHEQLVEKVARAACRAKHKGAIDCCTLCRRTGECCGLYVELDQARAAIAAIYEAMREPTPDQLTTVGTMAGWNEAANRGADDCHVEWWQAMLDASPLKGE